MRVHINVRGQLSEKRLSKHRHNSVDNTPFLEHSGLSYVVFPLDEEVADGAHVFRWNIHFPLNHPFPSKKCVRKIVQSSCGSFEFGIHNHLDRIEYYEAGSPLPKVNLIDKRQQHPQGSRRILLRSVARFDEIQEYTTSRAAFENANEKLSTCLAILRQFLAGCQLQAPFACSWLLTPPTFYELGGAAHSVIQKSKQNPEWVVHSSWPAFHVGKHALQPLFHMDECKDDKEVELILQLPYALLADANSSICRELPRIAVFNSYAAVEVFAEALYRRLKTNSLVAGGMSTPDADAEVNDQLKTTRDLMKLLLHTGLKEVTGRSLFDEQQTVYDTFFKLKKRRNEVVHSGVLPTLTEAKDAYKLCCEILAWVAKTGGIQVKPYYPDGIDMPEKTVFTFEHCPV